MLLMCWGSLITYDASHHPVAPLLPFTRIRPIEAVPQRDPLVLQ
jgi:hypothetical protein